MIAHAALSRQKRALLRQIRTAFSETKPPAGGSVFSKEVLIDYETGRLFGLTWQQLFTKNDEIVLLASDLNILDPPDATYLVPAYLMTAINSWTDTDLYSEMDEVLIPDGTRFLPYLFEQLAPSQRAAVCAFIMYKLALFEELAKMPSLLGIDTTAEEEAYRRRLLAGIGYWCETTS